MSTTLEQIEPDQRALHSYPEDEVGITIREKYKRMFTRLGKKGLRPYELEEAQTFPGGADELLKTLVVISLAMSVTGSTTRVTQ